MRQGFIDPLLLTLLSAMGLQTAACVEKAKPDSVNANVEDDGPTNVSPQPADIQPTRNRGGSDAGMAPTPAQAPTPTPSSTANTSNAGSAGTRASEEPMPPGGSAGTRASEEPMPPGGSAGTRASEEPMPPGGSAGTRASEEPMPLGGSGGVGGRSSVSTGGKDAGLMPEAMSDCPRAQPLVDESTGWIMCDSGQLYHRETIGACPGHAADDAGVVAPSLECGQDKDCSALERGRCHHDFSAAGSGPTGCLNDCLTDTDCPAGEICFCGETINRCIPSGCNSDSDCGDGFMCATYDHDICLGVPAGVECQTAEDECAQGAYCAFEGGRRVQKPEGECGRPFLVNGAARKAPLNGAAGWADSDSLSGLRLDLLPALRRELAEHYARNALMEHASVAAFARFSMELLALGAPAEFVVDSTTAMADELRHARLCFALATAYAGRTLGPGPLSLEGWAPAGWTAGREGDSLATLVETTFLEGCIGETIAALEAREMAEAVADPVLARILASIAADEARHATLAWRFVQWALGRNPALRVTLSRLTQQLAMESRRGHISCDASDEAWTYGFSTLARSQELRRRAIAEVILPCTATLLHAVPNRTVRQPTPCQPVSSAT